MKNISLKVITSLFLLFVVAFSDCYSQSGVYVGGHIRRERPKTITKLKESGFNYVILFNVNVEADGTLKTDGETICSNGQYVFGNTQPNYIDDIKSLKTAPTSINRIEICIGGWGNTSYTNIKNLIAAQGTGSGSMLYKNFQALKKAIPEIDAVNNDDEHCYDVNSAAAFHIMMFDLGYKTTLAPYMNKSFWQNLATNINNARSGAVNRILIQCYDGGAGNNPSDWHINNITLHAGRLNYQDFSESKSVMQDWKNNKNVSGGFFWVYNDETWNLNAYATATNRIFGAKTTNSPIATFYSDINYGGYSIQLPLGSFTTADMAVYGLSNDDITSLKVNSGYKVTVYVDNNFSGSSTSYTTNQTWIGDFNDKISSIKIEKYCKTTNSPAATFYADINYGGSAVSLPEGSFTTSDMADYCINDNSITSLKVNSGYKVTVYVDNNFSGSSTSYTTDQAWIGDFNDKISSIKIEKYCKKSDAAVATFYADLNYGGSAVSLPEGTFTTSDMAEYCINDNSISSIKVLPGYKVTVYVDNNFSGSSTSYTTNQSWIGDFNDKISSIKIEASGVSGFYGIYKIKGRNSGKYMDMYNNSTENRTMLVQWEDEGEEIYQQFDFKEIGNGVYSIASAASGRVLDVAGASKDNFTGLEIYDDYGATNQQFILIDAGNGYYQIVARHCGKVLEMPYDTRDNGEQVKIYDNNNQNCSHWSISRIVPAAFSVATFYRDSNYNGSAVNLPEGNYNLAKLKMYGIKDNDISSIKVLKGFKVTAYIDDNYQGGSQVYTENKTSLGSEMNDKISSLIIEAQGVSLIPGCYKIKGDNGLYLDMKDNSTENGTRLVQWTDERDEAYQLFNFVSKGNGVYSIMSVPSGAKVLDVVDNSGNNSAEIQIWDNYDAINQQFILVNAGSNKYQLVARNCGKVLDVPNSNPERGEYIKLWDNNDQKNSYWSIEASVFDADITDNGGTITASNAGIKTETIDKLIDNAYNTKYCANVPAGSEIWMQYQSPRAVILKSYSLTSANDSQERDPKTWKLQGKNTGTAWTDIDVRTNQTFANRFEKKTFNVSTTKSYSFFRLLVTERHASTASIFQLSEWQLFGDEVISTATSDIINSDIIIYPNPAKDFINIELKEKTDIYIYDMLGQVKYSGMIDEGINEIDVSNLSKGVYIIKTSKDVFNMIKE